MTTRKESALAGKQFRIPFLACLIVALACTAHAGGPVTFDDGAFGPVKPVSGKWYLEKGKALEMSDSWDEGRPFFATIRRGKTDNVRITVREMMLGKTKTLYLTVR